MPTHSGRDEDVASITYTYRPARDDWDAWKATVPRTTALYARLDTLLEYDREYDLDAMVDAWAGAPDADVSLAALRIKRRCAAGVQDARAADADGAAEALTEIKQIAEALLDADADADD